MPFVPLAVLSALVSLPSSQASHLSMDMPGLGGASLPPPSLALLVTATLAAVLQGTWLWRSDRRRPELVSWRDEAAGALALAPLAVSAARASTLAPSGELATRIADVGRSGSEHLWALLATLSLVVGFAAARSLEVAIAWRRRPGPTEAPDARRALAVLLLTGPFVGLILATSTGVDWISSWIRWGGCGLAALVCAAGALLPGPHAWRARGGASFVVAVVLALLAEREYVEALAHDALALRDPFDPAAEWVRGLREIAVAVEPRERYGVLAALLPCLALAPGMSVRAASRPLVAGLGVLAASVLVATATSSRLDAAALDAAAVEAPRAPEPEEEIVWSARVLPRTAPWLRAMRHPPEPPPPPDVRCAAWTMPIQPGG